MENFKKLVRLYVTGNRFSAGKPYALTEGQAHYLKNVMRKEQGTPLRVFNGHDGEWLATLEKIDKKGAFIKLERQLMEQEPNASNIWVLASPLKKEAFDLMIEKACELGAAKFIPVICEHTVVHKINQERLQAIATEASEQSERLDVMTVEPLTDLKKILTTGSYNGNLIFCLERGEGVPIGAAAKKLASSPKSLLIGPEGGFSAAEADFIRSCKNVHEVSLGKRILRAETALIAALAAIQLLN